MHINHKWIVGVIFLISINFLSCKKEWLEAKADKKQAVPATVKDFQALLDDIGLNVNGANLNEVAADGHYYTEASYNGMLPGLPQFQNMYSWTAITPYETMPMAAGYKDNYTTPYRFILNMNIILDELKKSKDQDRNGLEHVKAQALFNRARLFYELAQSFASPFKAETSNSDLGLALRLSSDVTENSVRSSVKQTYVDISAKVASKSAFKLTGDFASK